MASVAGRRGGNSSSPVEIAILPNLKSCLVNLPSNLAYALVNQNTVAQNVVVEIQYRPPPPAGSDPKARPPAPQSIFVGWTGMQSQAKLAPVVGRDGIRSGSQEKEVPTVEIDATFARRLGIGEGTKASVTLHLEPPQAHTVNIEPLTATDWEIIELHSSFLEMNFLSQVRALPNPAAGHTHPLTLHLTPTSTANITVTSLVPAPAAGQAFVKISPDAEVIVAPKTRQSNRPSSSRDNRSIASTGRRSAGGRSTASQVRHKSERESEKSRPPIFLRGVTRALQNEWFEDGGDDLKDEGLRVWLDREHLLSKTLRGVTWVAVTVIKPAGLQEPVDPQAQPTPDQQPAQKVIAKVVAWEDAPDSRHMALSSLLCSVLGCEGIVGGIVRIDPAPAALPRTASALKDPSQQASKENIVKRLRITPFAPTQAEKKAIGFKFGGESKTEKEEAVQRIKSILGKSILEGPITDGMLLPARDGWPGGIVDFDPAPPGDPSKTRTHWLIGGERKLEIAVQPETARQKSPQWPPGEALPEEIPIMVGIDATIEQTRKSLLHTSSVLLTGGLGSGKSSLAHLLAHQLRNEYLFNIIYFPCRTLVTDETRVKTIKDNLQRIFASAAWGARIGGRSVVILDDIDKLCPVETELQVDANGRSRQVSELLCSTVRQWCNRDTGVVMLATAQGKEAVNNVVIGGHVVRDIIALKAPSKDGRRKVLELLVKQAKKSSSNDGAETILRDGGAAHEWMESSDGEPSRPTSANGPVDVEDGFDPDLDLLDIAGQTDGYMPGDLALLVSRARSEALIRAVSEESLSDDVNLTGIDFTAALKGFTPASLRGVTLHSSTTTFASIGGLTETRQTLLETLQYPTTYAPLFAKCPLRLRSGLLLYGYPGCGKTLLASAVAGECGLNFISVKGPEILNKYIGASEKSVRDLFERAEAAKPCVLFFDEFDAIAPKRGHDSTGVTDRVVNMLLTMMDGAEGLSGVYVLAATSRPDLIDPALLRPGRLDKSLICDMPNEIDRLDILRAISKKLHLSPDLLEETNTSQQSLQEVARRTEGYSGADLQAVMYNAHLDAIHDILGDAASSQELSNPKKQQQQQRGNKHQDFTWFQMGDLTNDSTKDNTPTSLAQQAAERAKIASKLQALQLSRRKAKAERQASRQQPQSNRPGSAMSNRSIGRPSSAHGTNGTTSDPPSTSEPIIQWHHLQKSLTETRSSISKQEQARLARIYKEFVVGRDGNMTDGQGSTEIGGRTSLM
ncbi:Peroxisome biosynthesis protein PAS1 [Pseudocercospora fuligena]|uniref:Peroxisomal ATPase PEX1 n=1 Tax=Pseudocercospora fuligena TaxID=685502 RepID=A0A8H6RRN2_9PEZI|nr:Peroxisome biosynthesis protein PAS1 [Pseudocercospora fuligena]